MCTHPDLTKTAVVETACARLGADSPADGQTTELTTGPYLLWEQWAAVCLLSFLFRQQVSLAALFSHRVVFHPCGSMPK